MCARDNEDKTKLNAAITANDTGRIITSKEVIIQWLLEDNLSATSTSQIHSPILTPILTEFLSSYPHSAILTLISTLSTNTNFHSMLILRPCTQSNYQTCPLCPPSCTCTFKQSALQQHLSSIIHAQVPISLPLLVSDKMSFHCPRALISKKSKKKTVRQFLTVSKLAQHLESGACDERKETFRRIIDYVQEEMKNMRFDRLKLLS